MKAGPEQNAKIMSCRMRPLPRRHRIAHLRALVRQQPADSIRRDLLTSLLRETTTARPPGKEAAGAKKPANDSSIKSCSFKE